MVLHCLINTSSSVTLTLYLLLLIIDQDLETIDVLM